MIAKLNAAVPGASETVHLGEIVVIRLPRYAFKRVTGSACPRLMAPI
jgi:hypothetical protein